LATCANKQKPLLFQRIIKGNGKYVYLSISDVRFFRNEWYNHILIRSAESERDYCGGHNNYTSLPNLQSAVGFLLGGKK